LPQNEVQQFVRKPPFIIAVVSPQAIHVEDCGNAEYKLG
jgi:hypothetical protein